MSWIEEKGPNQDVVISSRIRFARNIRNTPFPGIIDQSSAQKIIDMVYESLDSISDDDSKYEKILINQLNDTDKNILIENYHASQDLIKRPDTSAVLLNKEKNIAIMINEEDHIRMQCILPGLQLTSAFEQVDGVDNIVESSVDYSYDEQLGYLTACPTNVGTGMRASIMMHLPGLVNTRNMESILNTLSKIGLTVRGIYGENTDVKGNIFQISNQVTMGRSEGEIIHNLNAAATHIIEKERLSRDALYKSGHKSFEDNLWRAYGILSYARTLSLKETMILLSKVRLGVDMGIITDVEHSDLNEIMINAQPAHLRAMSKSAEADEDINNTRAEMIRRKLNM